MKTRIAILAVLAAPMALMLGACESAPSSNGGGGSSAGGPTMAIIRGGGTSYFGDKMGAISLVDIDGVKPTHSGPPYEVSPGVHKIRLKCDQAEDVKEFDFVAGDIYEFGIVPREPGKSCRAAMEQVRRGKKKD